MSRILPAVLLVASLLTFTPPAEARHHMTFQYASLVAIDYWDARGVVLPCQPKAHVLTPEGNAQAIASYGEDVVMFADTQTCEVDITTVAESYRTDREEDWMYCQAIAHEIGHLAGLEHSRGGLMNAYLDLAPIPFGCAYQRQWMVKQGWRQPPRWIQRSPLNVRRLWLAGHGYAAQTARQVWLRRRNR